MAYRQQQAVSKPLLIILVIVVIIGAIVFARNMSTPADENNVSGVPPIPKDLKPPPPDPLGRGPVGGG
jgi:hypothetical protein